MTLSANDKIALVGDSRWSMAFDSLDPRDGIDYKLQSLTPLRVLNYSGNGQRITRAGGYEWAQTSFVDCKHGLMFPHGIGELKLVIIMLGYNDWANSDSTGLGNYAKAMRDVFQFFKQVNIQVVVVSDIYTIDEESIQNTGGHTLNNYRATAQSVANEWSLHFVDGKTLIPQQQQYYSGGIHPNASGHTQMANNLYADLYGAGIFL